MTNANHAFLILSDSLSTSLMILYNQIYLATRNLGDTSILYHNKKEEVKIPDEWNSITYSFTDESLAGLSYTPIRNTLIPGSNHFPLLKFYLENKCYDYYWLIEDDVIFNGDWKYFFDRLLLLENYDFISSYIEYYNVDPNWKWWSSLSGPSADYKKNKFLKSFNPLYRISSKALTFIHEALSLGWSGHHEVLLPTLLYNNNFKLVDFGGDGAFTPTDYKNCLYTKDTYRWRPIFELPGNDINKLYHPVKKIIPKKKNNYKVSFCVISMNRLQQFAKTILQNIVDNLDYPKLEVVIVDYNSNDGLENWCKENLNNYIINGLVIYYRTEQPKVFNHSHAKNLAFKLASGDIVCNINADHFTGKGFASYLNHQFKELPNIVITPIPKRSSEKVGMPKDVLGKVCVKKEDFLKINGFDERMRTYGFEDFDFINRLEMINIKRVSLKDVDYLKYLSHPDSARFSLEEHYNNLNKILIQYISPSMSNIIFLYQNNKFEMGKIVDNAVKKASNFKYSYIKRKYLFEYSVENTSWTDGTWKILENNRILNFQSSSNNRFQLVQKEQYYETLLDNTIVNFFTLTDLKCKEELLNFHYLFRNRSLLEQNLEKKEKHINSRGFGKAVVFKNFEKKNSIIID